MHVKKAGRLSARSGRWREAESVFSKVFGKHWAIHPFSRRLCLRLINGRVNVNHIIKPALNPARIQINEVWMVRLILSSPS